MNTFDYFLSGCPVIVVLRGILTDETPGVCDALYRGGANLLEIPLNSPDPFRSIEKAVRHAGARQLVGAGTVLAPEDVRRVADAGGKYIVSPNTDPDVITETRRLGLVSIPGFYTPTEAFAAIKAGADYLKLFPAGQAGAGYIKDLRAVIKKPILAVAGINMKNIREFASVCAGVGVGGAIYKPGKALDEIERDAAIIVKMLNRPSDSK